MFSFLCNDPECECTKAVEEMLMGMVVASAQCSPLRASLTLRENVKITFNIPQHLGGGVVEFNSHERKDVIPVEDTDVFKIKENQQPRRGNERTQSGVHENGS